MLCGLLLVAVLCSGQTPAVKQLVERLGAEADEFERSAHRVVGMETLKQTVPAGFHVSRRGIETKVPEHSRVIVSQYSYIPVDEKGGSLREARNILTVDGLQWNKKQPLDSLAKAVTVRTDVQRRKLLEDFESHGLAGILTDSSQSILLFAQGNAGRYEFTYEGEDKDEIGVPLYVLRFQQIDGNQAFHVYENKGVVSDKLRGKVWFRKADLLPVKVGMETVRQLKQSKMRDTVVVSYAKSDFGFLLPAKVLHEQYENNFLNVVDAFDYSDFRQIVSAPRSR